MRIVFFSTSSDDLLRFRLPVARHLAEAGYDVLFISPPDPHTGRIEEFGFSFLPFEDQPSGYRPLSDILSAYKLAEIYSDHNPDIVHHFGLDAVVRGGIAAHRANLPWIVHSVSGPDLAPSTRPYWLRTGPKFVLRRAMRDAEVTVQSDADRQLLISKGSVRPEFVHVVGGEVIDPEKVPFQDEPNRAPVAALIGRFESVTELESFVEAAGRIRASDGGKGSTLPRFAVVAPTAELPQDVQQRLEQWQEEGTVEWWPRTDVDASLSGVHVVVARSCRAYDTRASLLTAAATGRAIVAVDSVWCRPLVRHDTTGLLVRQDDSQELTAALSDLLFDADRRRAMGRQARSFIVEEHAARHIAKQHMAVYQRLYERGREI